MYEFMVAKAINSLFLPHFGVNFFKNCNNFLIYDLKEE